MRRNVGNNTRLNVHSLFKTNSLTTLQNYETRLAKEIQIMYEVHPNHTFTLHFQMHMIKGNRA